LTVLTAFPPWVKLLKGWCPAERPQPQGNLQQWAVYRDTSRTRRLTGYLETSQDLDCPREIPPFLRDTLLSLFKKRDCLTEVRLLDALAGVAPSLSLDAGRLAGMLVAYGWLGRWIRLRPDEKSIQSVVYGPMPALDRLLRDKKGQIVAENRAWLEEMAKKFKTLKDLTIDDDTGVSGDFLTSVTVFLDEKMSSLWGQDTAAEGLRLRPDLPWTFKWDKPRGRFHLGVEFLLALLLCLKRSPGGFEWKELGAVFEAGIGGSKRFDRAREELITLAEAISGLPLEEVGLTSRGSLYSIYLLGKLILTYRSGEIQEFLSPTVHALTNIQAQKIKIVKTPARRVVLTENRALLLKMERRGWQRQEPESLVVGIDGRLRLGHARMIKILKECNPDLAWFAWLDTDASGAGIAGEIAGIIPGAGFVLPLQGEAGSPLEYREWLAELENNPELRGREQEEDLGDLETWQKMFSTAGKLSEN